MQSKKCLQLKRFTSGVAVASQIDLAACGPIDTEMVQKEDDHVRFFFASSRARKHHVSNNREATEKCFFHVGSRL